MTNQSTLTSIRLDDDTLQGLDMLVGQNGLNNRSDVIRLAIQQLLTGQAKLPGMKSVRTHWPTNGTSPRFTLRIVWRIP